MIIINFRHIYNIHRFIIQFDYNGTNNINKYLYYNNNYVYTFNKLTIFLIITLAKSRCITIREVKCQFFGIYTKFHYEILWVLFVFSYYYN